MIGSEFEAETAANQSRPATLKSLKEAQTITHRRAHEHEVGALAEIVMRCNVNYGAWAPVGWVVPPQHLEYQARRIHDRLRDPSAWLRVAQRRGVIVGLASWRPSHDAPARAVLSWMFVEPGTQCRGIGGRLLEAAHASMREAQHSAAELWVPEQNRRARSFYERGGWRPTPASRRHPALGLDLRRYTTRLQHPPVTGP